ncbi:hypothetical protein C8J57DRAFT_1529475 [Mycena rebaudengoi]|nr:hypothetical protein C8J57DRAFT_1529475 [Mycena rebaudengoi]
MELHAFSRLRSFLRFDGPVPTVGHASSETPRQRRTSVPTSLRLPVSTPPQQLDYRISVISSIWLVQHQHIHRRARPPSPAFDASCQPPPRHQASTRCPCARRFGEDPPPLHGQYQAALNPRFLSSILGHPKRLGMSVAGFAPRHCRDCYMPARRCAAYSGIHPRLVLWRTRRSYPPERVSRVATSKLAGSSTYPVSRIGFYIHFASVPVFPITLESSSAFSTSKPFTRSSHPAQSVLRCLDESPRSPGRTNIHTIILGDVKGTSKRRACPTLCH